MFVTLLIEVCVVCGLFQVFLLLLVWFNAELAWNFGKSPLPRYSAN